MLRPAQFEDLVLRDGIEEAAEVPRPKLNYPFATRPEAGEAVDVADGVKWLRMPLGGPLAAINVWAIRDGDGWAIVDTGIAGVPTRDTWRAAFQGPLEGRPVTRVFVTHMHPDHIGMAGWLTRKFGCELWITRLEFVTCRSLALDTGREAPDVAVRFYRACGWDEDAIDQYKAKFGGFGRGLHVLPDSFRRLSDGERVRIGDHDWEVVVGSGHSPEHASLWCHDLGLLISGDQVLPKISSNVSVFPTEPEADPLTEWLVSLAAIKARVPDEVLVLPAHNEPFHGLHARLDHLIAGHERGLARLTAELAAPRRVIDVFHVLFRRPIGPELLGLATGESLAHLNCLRRRGLAVRDRDADGIDWYRVAA